MPKPFFRLIPVVLILGAGPLRAGPVRRHEVYAPQVERGYVYESRLDGFAYNHCATVMWFRDRWIAAWNANPLPGEPTPGHEIAVSISRDGVTWSEPFTPFSDPALCDAAARYPQAKQWQPCSIIVDDEYWMFFNQSSPNPPERGTYFARLDDPDGRWILRRLDWGADAGRVRLLGKEWSVFPSQNPLELRSGRIVVPVVLQSGRAPDAPEQMTSWWANEKRASVIYSDDRGETWRVSPGCTPEGRSWAPWEPSVWEQSDGSLAMVFRHNAHPSGVDPMPGPAEFLYGAVSRDGGQTWTRPVFVPIETICSRMAVAPLDGGGSWNPVDPDADYGGRLHLMLHHDVPGGVGWTYDRRNLALFFRRGDGFEFTAGPGFSGLEPRAVYPQHAIHDGTLLVLYTQSHAEKRSIRYARITPLPDPEKRYLLPRADVVPDRRPSPDRSILRFESLALQHLNARATPDLAAGRVALAAWLRPDCDGILWDNRAAAEDGRASGFAWGLVALGGTGDRAARPVLFLQFTGQRFLSRLAVPQSEWNYAAVEWDGPGRKLRFRVGDQVEELEIPEGVTLDPTGGAGVIGAGRDRQRRGPAFHGDIRYLAVFDHLPGPAAHRALHDRFSAGSGRELPGASLPDTMSPVLELDPADPEALARDFAFPEAGFQGVRWIRLLGHSVMRVTGEGSAGVDLDENHRVRGDTVWLRFRFLPEQGNRLVICTVGDANHPARVQWRDDTVYLVAGEREERIGPAPRGRWTTVEIESAGTWTRASVEGHDPVRVRHVPEGTWVYLGQGYRTGGASVGDVFLVDAGSVESRVARAPEPHRALYNNDGLGGGVMSLRTWGARLGPDAEYADLLRAAVDEMAGLGPHLFAAGDGWVVWWRSREYPIEEHLRWLHEMAYSEERAFHLGRQAEYILDGGDLVQTFVDHCRRVGVPPYISFRMNDYHWSEWLWLPEPLRSRELFGRSHWPLSRISRFLFENWEYRIGPPHAAYQALQTDEERMAFILNPQRRTSLRDRGVLDWAQPAVREHKLAFFRELAGYDLDGIEMDFMRHSRFFKDEHPVEDRIAIMTEFVRDVRRALDEAAPDGRRRRLVARVPSRLVQMPQLGVDLERFVEAGLSDVILSQHFNTTPDSDLARVVRMLPGTPVYLEMTQCSARIDGIWRFVTPEQIATAAHVTYARGGAGLSYFNIQYYRQGGDQSSERGLQCDIPFDTMRRVTDPAAAARLPQHYFVGPGHNIPPAEGARQLPRELLHGSPVEVRIDCAPPAGGWTAGGRLRVEATSAWADRQVTLRVNGVVCEPAEDVSAPLPGPYLQPESEPRPERLRAWAVPPELLVDGENSVRLELESGDGLRIFFVDLGFPK